MKKFVTKFIGATTAAALSTVTLAQGTNTLVNAASKPTEISFWHGQTGVYQEELDKQIKEFNDSQSKYKVVGTSQGNYTTLQQKITAAAKSKTLPVLAQAVYTQVPDYVNNGIVKDLDAQLNGKDGLSKKQQANIYPGFLDSSKYKGKFYSMPFSVSVRVMFYNKTLLKQYGVDVPKTWDDIQKLAEKVKGTDVAALGFDQSFDMEWNGMVRAAGKSLVTKNFKSNIASKQAVAAADAINKMVKDGTAKTAGSDIYGTNNFVNGKTILSYSSSAGVSATKAQAPEGFEWGTAAIPSYKGKHATQLAGNSLVVTSTATKKQTAGAWAFMKFLASDKQTEAWAEATGYLPITKKATNSKSYKAYLKANPLAAGGADSLKYAFTDTPFLGYNEYRTDLVTMTSNILTKDEAPKKALKTLDSQVKTLLKANK
ncbi:MAG: ABC transporter substrate-binding protein [Lactobacillaceae bacterium]|jgi:multiple sugar transport system substrate-binding protein|nr:ABC transporter substrate-binding protein [Lactobacillaceae bacterium]